MKILIYNDTSEYHSGCKQVMNYLHDEIKINSHEIADSFSQADAILVNGQNSMCGRTNISEVILDVMTRALRMGKQVALVNTVFQDMDLTDAEVETLKNSYISVREVKSQNYLSQYDIKSDVHLDLSYWCAPASIFREDKLVDTELTCGEFFFRPPYRIKNTFLNRVNIFSQQWSELIDEVRRSEWFITGRHHEMYAACIAETPFVVLRSNTWKNEGLLETAGVNIPTVDGHATDEDINLAWATAREAERNGEYKKLFNFMRNEQRLKLENVFCT